MINKYIIYRRLYNIYKYIYIYIFFYAAMYSLPFDQERMNQPHLFWSEPVCPIHSKNLRSTRHMRNDQSSRLSLFVWFQVTQIQVHARKTQGLVRVTLVESGIWPQSIAKIHQLRVNRIIFKLIVDFSKRHTLLNLLHALTRCAVHSATPASQLRVRLLRRRCRHHGIQRGLWHLVQLRWTHLLRPRRVRTQLHGRSWRFQQLLLFPMIIQSDHLECHLLRSTHRFNRTISQCHGRDAFSQKIP